MADRSVRVRLSATTGDFTRALAGASAKARAFASDLDSVDNRMSGIVQTGLALGPALVPVIAGTSVAAAGLASGFGAAATGAGAAALAFSGVGDALDTVNDYQLEPTAANLEKMRAALTELGPAGAQFVHYLQSLRPELDDLQSIARQGLFPGVEAGIEQVRSQLPLLESIVGNVAVAMGNLAREGGQALAGPFWTDFLRFIRDDAAAALEGMGRGFGNIAEGFAGLTMAMDPVADDFGGALLRMSEAFSQWGRNVGQTQGFRDFVAYLREVGPQIGDTVGAVANALVQLGQAAAPVGGVVLEGIEGVAHALAAIANIPIVGPALIGAAAGIATLSRAVALYRASGMSSLVTGLRGMDAEGKKASTAMTGVARAGVALVGIGVGLEMIERLQDAIVDSVPGVNELTNRLRDLGSGLGSNLGVEFDDLGQSIDRVTDPGRLTAWGDAMGDFFNVDARSLREARTDIDALDTAFAQLVQQEGPEAARQAFVDMAHAQRLTSGEARRLASQMPQYREALEGVGTDADLAAEGLTAAQRAAQQLNDELAQLAANLDRRAAMRAYRDSIRQFNQTLKDGPKNLRKGTAAYDEAMGALDGIAASSVTAASHLKGLNKIEFMQQARRDFIAAAKQMDLTGGQARNLADRLGLVNQKGKINIHLRAQGLDKATQDLRRTKEAADRIPKRIDARVQGNTGDAQRDLGVVAKKMRDLDNDRAVPKADLTDNASPKARVIQAILGGLDRQRANPDADLNDNASGGISRVAALLSGLDGRVARTTVENTTINRTVNIVEGRGGTPIRLPSAIGNIFTYDQGDVADRHQPELAGPGPMRVWREPETKGESYIPHADDHRRARAIDIWERTGDILGVQFARFNAGGGLYGARHFDNGGFVGGPGPITRGYLQDRLDIPERLPNLREYNRALRERAHTLRVVRRERRQLTRENKQAREAEKALRLAEREVDKAERTLSEAENKKQRQRAREELKALREDVRDAKHRSRTQAKQAEQAEKDLAKAKDAHAKAQRRVSDAVQEYADKQRAAIEQARQTAEGLAGSADIFGGFASPMGAQRTVDHAIENVAEYGQMLAKMRAKGVHPWLLAQFEQQGPTDAGLRLGRALLSDPAALKRLSRSAGALTQLSERVGTMTADPRFSHTGDWDPRRAMSTRALNVEIRALDVSQLHGEIVRQVRHLVRAELETGRF